VPCPLYAALPADQQLLAFAPAQPGSRKVILATNIAESSVTISGIRYVIDCGLVKCRIYNPRIALDCLHVVPCSKAQTRQRAGRAGREAPGVCYRLFTEHAFMELDDAAVPEVKRCKLDGIVLTLKAMGIDDLQSFEFLEAPSRDSLVEALNSLHVLGALDDKGSVTPLGTKMSQLPLEPVYSKVIIASEEHKCVEEIITIVAAMSVEQVFFAPAAKRREAEAAKRSFASPDGDHLSLLNVWNAFTAQRASSREWCRAHFVNANSMRKIQQVRQQLANYCESLGLGQSSAADDPATVCRCLVAGLFANAAKLDTQARNYRTFGRNQVVFTHPQSVLFRANPQPNYVVFSELVLTTKMYMRFQTRVEVEWLIQAAPAMYRRAEPSQGDA